jgi:hypothetical protein
MVKTAANPANAMIDPIASQLKTKPKNLRTSRSTIRVPSPQAGSLQKPPAKVKSAGDGGAGQRGAAPCLPSRREKPFVNSATHQ